MALEFTPERLAYTQEADFRQERDFSRKISATFEFIGAHWRGLGRVLLTLVVPVALLQGIAGALLQSEIFAGMRGRPGRIGSFGWQWSAYSDLFTSPTYYLSLALSVTFTTVLVLSVYGYMRACVYPSVPGAPVTVGDVGNLVKRLFVGTFFSSFGIGLLVGVAMLVLFVPGIYLAVVLSLFFVVRVMEETSFTDTISRCLSLIKGKWWSTAGLIFIMALLVYFVMIGFGIAGGLAMVLGRGMLPTADVTVPTLSITLAALSSLLKLLLYPPLLIALAFQYFNLVERKEGVGMYRLVDQLGQAAPAGPTASAYRPTEEGEY